MINLRLPPPIDPLNDGKSYLCLIDAMGNILSIVNDARQSLDGHSEEWSERDAKLLKYLIKHQHTSPFRGVVFKWMVKAPLFIARQWYKHTIASTYVDDQLGWNEKSFRYCPAQDAEFYVPAQFASQAASNRQASGEPLDSRGQALAAQIYTKTVEESRQAYNALLAAGASREQARGVLTPCMYTSFVWTCSLQALLHFISLRIDKGAQSEICAYAEALLKLAEPIAPEVFEAFAETHYQF